MEVERLQQQQSGILRNFSDFINFFYFIRRNYKVKTQGKEERVEKRIGKTSGNKQPNFEDQRTRDSTTHNKTSSTRN